MGTDTSLLQIVYTSTLTVPALEREHSLKTISDASQRNNPGRGVTGAFADWAMRVGALDASAPDADRIRIILDAYGRTFKFELREYVEIAHRQLGLV